MSRTARSPQFSLQFLQTLYGTPLGPGAVLVRAARMMSLTSVKVGSLMLNWKEGSGGVGSPLQGGRSSSLRLSHMCWLNSSSEHPRVPLRFCPMQLFRKSEGICYEGSALASPLSAPSPEPLSAPQRVELLPQDVPELGQGWSFLLTHPLVLLY